MQANAPAPEEKGVNIAKFALRKFRIDRAATGHSRRNANSNAGPLHPSKRAKIWVSKTLHSLRGAFVAARPAPDFPPPPSTAKYRSEYDGENCRCHSANLHGCGRK
jgi:hypothetical protein